MAPTAAPIDREAFLARLATTAYQVALKHGIRGSFAELETEECPFDPPPPTAYRRGAVWLEPVLTAKVELTEFTNDGYVRQSSFIDLIEPT